MRANRSPFVLAALTLGALLLAGPGLSRQAEEPEKDRPGAEAKKPQDGSKRPETAPRLYTNADLERLFGPPGPAPVPEDESGKPAVDPLKSMQDDQARLAVRQRVVPEAEKSVATAEARVKQLEQRLLRIRNPLLPRPELDNEGLGGGMTDEEKEEWEGLDNAERRDRTEKQLEEARKALADAKKELERLRSGS